MTLKGSLKTLWLELDSNDDYKMLDEFYTKVISVVDTFQNLCWLIGLIHMCNDVELDKDHIYNAFHVVFLMMPQLTQLHLFQESGLDTTTLTLEPLLIEHLPKLLNLEYRIFNDFIFNGFICHYEDQIIYTSATNLALERLAIKRVYRNFLKPHLL